MKDSLRMPIDCSHSYYSMVDVLYVAEKALKFAGMKRPWRLWVGKLKNSLGFIWLWVFLFGRLYVWGWGGVLLLLLFMGFCVWFLDFFFFLVCLLPC